MKARIIKPTVMTVAMLASSTAVEAYAEYNAATAYALNARCTKASTGRVYECIQGPSTGNDPATSPLWWSDYGPSNTWAMFDALINTASTATNSLTVAVDTGYCNSVSMMGLVGKTAAISVTDGPGGAVLYSKTVDLDGTIIDNWYQYFFEPAVQLNTLWLTDLPPYVNARLITTITATGPVAVGMQSFGTFYELGDAQLGAAKGFISYSKKNTAINGVTTFVPGASAKRINVALTVAKAQINKVDNILTSLDAVPCMLISVDDAAYSSLAAWGFVRDFGLVVEYQMQSLFNLEFESLI